MTLKIDEAGIVQISLNSLLEFDGTPVVESSEGKITITFAVRKTPSHMLPENYSKTWGRNMFFDE
jgi:hypothetical protein